MTFVNYFFKRLLLFIFYFDLGFTYFLKITLYENFIKFQIYLLTKNKLVKLYKNLNILDEIRWISFFSLFSFFYFFIIELLNELLLFLTNLKNSFLIQLKSNKLKAPSLEIYYPLKTSIFSITLRITGVYLALGLGLFF